MIKLLKAYRAKPTLQNAVRICVANGICEVPKLNQVDADTLATALAHANRGPKIEFMVIK